MASNSRSFMKPFRAIAAGLILLISNLVAQKTAIVVLDFEGYGVSEPEVITLTNRLRNELFRLGSFRVVDRGMMQSILAEQDFQLSGCSSDECLVEIGRLVGAEQAVGGSIGKVANVFSISARIVDVETGELLNVADYDITGELSDALTVGIPEIARLLADMPPTREDQPIADSDVQPESPVQPESTTPSQPEFQPPSGASLMPRLFVGLDANMLFSMEIENAPGKGPKVLGISGGLGAAVKKYRKPLVTGQFNVYYAYGTDVFILPFVSYGGDFILASGKSYWGLAITSRLVRGFVPIPLLSAGLIF